MRIRKQKSVKQTCFPWIILLIFCFIQKNQLNGVRRLKIILAIYFMMENSQANEYREFYNDKLIQNYYDPERIEKRDHPLKCTKNNLFI